MSAFNSTHFITKRGGKLEVTAPGSGVVIEHGNDRIVLTLTPKQYASVAAACAIAIEQAERELRLSDRASELCEVRS